MVITVIILMNASWRLIIVRLMLDVTIPLDHIPVNVILDLLVMERLVITSTSVPIQVSVEPIQFALMNQVITNVTVTKGS